MKKLATLIALILVLTSVLVLASCRMGGNDGKDTSTPPVDTTTPAPVIPDDSTTPEDTTTEPWGPGTTVPEDTTTPPAEETTPIAPEDIVWTDANVTVYISLNNAWIRKSPDMLETSKHATLKFGDALECIATSENWYKVTYGGETCYVAASCVTTDNLSENDFEAVNDKVYVTVTSAWLRQGPSTNTEALSYALKDAELTRVAKSSTWSKVVVDEKTYYISNSVISETKPAQ